MEKQSVLAMFLIFALWMVYFLVFAPKPPPGPIPQSVESRELTAEEEPKPPESGKKRGKIAEPTETAQLSEVDTTEVAVDTVVVSSDLYEYHFITRGGVLTRAWLKQYPAFSPKGRKAKPTSSPVQLIPTEKSLFLYTRLRLKNLDAPIELGSRHFEPDRRALKLDVRKPEGSVEFVHRLASGKEVKLVYTFRHDSYLINAALYLPEELYGLRENTVEVLLGPSLVSNEKDPKQDYANYGTVYYDSGELISKSLKDLSESDWSPSGEHRILWGGIKSKYFISTFFVPDAPMSGMSASGNMETHTLNFRGSFPIPQKKGPIDYSIYLGPQAYEQINRLNYGLQKILQYGWSIIQPFSKISLAVLLWMHKWIENYALILVFFALLVKVVFYPLTIKSTKSQIKMQQIQPLMNELRARYKDDPRKLQEEMMRLYKEHKVNPLGGCLPLLIQFPVLIALFYVFQRTIEFRGAEAFGWIHDLSQPDPLYILPVAMGLTTFLQQKLTPTPTDPKMAPMMYIMPVVMTFIFMRFSSGLVFYYTFVNIFQIIQQLYINRRYHTTATPPKAPVAARAKKAALAAASGGKKKGSSRKR